MNKCPSIVHIDQVATTESANGRFRYKRKMLGSAAEAKKLGCSLYEVAPGMSAWPKHYHWANEEAIFVLEGEGTLRLGDDEFAIRAGHFVALLSGPAHAHRVINSSQAPLRYLCFSTAIETDVVVYPDSKKVGVGVGPAGKKIFAGVYRMSTAAGYFDDEPDASGTP